MSITVSWDDDSKGIIWMDFIGKWNWLDFARAHDEAAKMMRSVSHRVDVVVDMRHAGTTPINNDNQALRESVELMPANYGVTVYLGANRFTQMMISIMQGYIPRMSSRIWMAATLDDAANIILTQREAARA